MSRSHRSMAGFTLVEMMIVIGVLGLLIMIAVPSIVGFQRTARLTGAANTLASDLRFTRSLASAQRTTYQITFSPTFYTVTRVAPATTVRTRSIPKGIKLTATNNATFYPWGLAAAATVTFADTLSNNSARGPQVVRLGSNGSVSRD